MKCGFLFIAMFVVGSNAAVAPFITPCSRSDNDCILNSAKKALPYYIEGIKDLDVPPVVPLFIKEAIADTGDLKLKFEDLKVVGINKAELVEITRNVAKSTCTIVIETPIEVTGTYTAGGKLLFVDIEGHGDILLKTDKIRLVAVVNLKKFDKDGKTYYKVDGYDFKYEVLDEFIVKLDNLFNGDEKKAAPIMTIIRENWRALLNDVGKPVIEQIVDIEVKNIEKFFKAVPADELELA